MTSVKFKAILADPPWPYKSPGPGSSPSHRPNSWNSKLGKVDSKARYGSITMNELKSLNVPFYTDDNSHLYLWTTNAFIVQAHELAKAWGFRPITIITWGKVKPDGTPSMKTGYYFRGATEHLLFCVHGSLRLQGPAAPTLVLSRRLSHSTKPEWSYEMIEQQSPGPYLELFARKKRRGWKAWGNEIKSDIVLKSGR